MTSLRLLLPLFLTVGAGVLNHSRMEAQAPRPPRAPNLFGSPDALPAGEDKTQSRRPVLRSRRVVIDRAALPTSESRVGTGVVFNCFADAVCEGRLQKLIFRSHRSYSWVGQLIGHDGPFILTVEDDLVLANIRSRDRGYFQVRPSMSGGHETREIDERQYSPCGVGPELLPARLGSAPVPFGPPGDDGSVFDLMVVYTPAARRGAGGVSAMLGTIHLALDETNQAYALSEIPSRIRLVHRSQVDYIESGTVSIDLSRLIHRGDGYMDSVHGARNASGADLVALFTEHVPGDGAAGYAAQMTQLSPDFATSAFSVTNRGAATGIYLLAHELGHNMGVTHDLENANTLDPVFDYSFGWRFFGISGTEFRTIMAYAPGHRVQRFSNPRVAYDDTLTGSSGEADNALSITNAAFTIANWRPSVHPPRVLNDDCGGAIPVSSGTFAFDLRNATLDGPNACGEMSTDVWYLFEAPISGTLEIDSAGFPTEPSIAVFGPDSPCPSDPTGIRACAPGCDSQGPCVQTWVTAGSLYLIQMGGPEGPPTAGVFDLAVFSNDDCIHAATIGMESVNFSTENATTDGPIACTGLEADVWYRVLVPGDGTLRVDIPDSNFDAALAVYESGFACPPDLSQVLDCDSGTAGIETTVEKGSEVWIQLGGSGGDRGRGTLQVSFTPKPCGEISNLTCASAGPHVNLSWVNGDLYATIPVGRDGELIATLPGDATSYIDTDTSGGNHEYMMYGACQLSATSLATCEIQHVPSPCEGVRELSCASVGNDVLLAWTNGDPYDSIRVLRDGAPIASLSGDRTSFLDGDARANVYTYAIEGSCGGSAAGPLEECTVLHQPAMFLRGDATGDGALSGIVDGVAMLQYQFQGEGSIPCREAADADDNGSFNGLVDAVFVFRHHFQAGPPPPPPYPSCGLDPFPRSGLGCDVAPGCP